MWRVDIYHFIIANNLTFYSSVNYVGLVLLRGVIKLAATTFNTDMVIDIDYTNL